MANISTKPQRKVPPIGMGINAHDQIVAAQNSAIPLTVKTPIANRDWITFIDLDYRREDNKGRSTKAYDYITLPTIPLELAYDVESDIPAIASFGRNNPFLMWTGSEDTLNFQIDFYSKVASKQDVIYWCRWLESMAKSDGYLGGMHRVLLVWGKDDKLFGGDTWYISKASYKLSQFQGHKSLLPAQAFQDITMKRVTDHNRTTQEIFGNFYRPATASDGWSAPTANNEQNNF